MDVDRDVIHKMVNKYNEDFSHTNGLLNITQYKNLDVCEEEYLEDENALNHRSLSSTGFNLNHKLHTTWSFWIDRSQRNSSPLEYLANLQKIYTITTVEEFWSVYNNMPSVDKISQVFTYHLMREDRKPLWEDEQNQKGGTWKLKISKLDTVNVWRELLLAAIGEQFDASLVPGDDICGVSVSVKERDDLIQIWNLDSRLADSASVTEKVQELVPETEFMVKFYKAHQSHRAYDRGKF